MLKVAILCNYNLNPNRIGGMDRFFKLLDEELKEKGYAVDWFFKNGKNFDFYKNLKIYDAKNGIVEEKFLEISKKENLEYNIIATHFLELCTKFYKEFKSVHNKAYIVAVDHNPRPLNGFPLKKRLKKKLEGILYAKYIDKFIGVSKYTTHHILNDYGRFLKNKTKVVYNGIDTDVFIKNTNNNKNKFIVASHLRHSKGIQDLLKALSVIDNKLLKNVKIDIFGEGPYKEELLNLTIKYNLENIIEFNGSSSSLNKLFCNYRYMIQPTYMECFSLSILESLSANVPVITTDVGGNLEVITDEVNGFIHKPKDYHKLSLILEGILKNEKEITIETSKLIEKDFYLEKMVQEHINILTKR